MREAELFTGGREVARAIMPFLTGWACRSVRRRHVSGCAPARERRAGLGPGSQDNWRLYGGPSEPIPAEIADERFAGMVR
jgi:hypothetical protein